MTDQRGQGPESTGRSRSQTARLAALGTLIVLALVFALLNTATVRVNWIITTTRTPLIVVIVGCLATGFLIGAGIARLGERRRRRAGTR